ncbi:peroxiredoxin, partial [Streptobacillus ratti]
NYENFKAESAEIYSISCDTAFVHKAWSDHSPKISKVEYPMIGDPTGFLAREFGVMIEEEGLALRGSFVINPEGKIVAYEIHDNGIGREASELLRKLQAAKFVAKHGEVCPAKWKPGKETLKPSINLVGEL